MRLNWPFRQPANALLNLSEKAQRHLTSPSERKRKPIHDESLNTTRGGYSDSSFLNLDVEFGGDLTVQTPKLFTSKWNCKLKFIWILVLAEVHRTGTYRAVYA